MSAHHSSTAFVAAQIPAVAGFATMIASWAGWISPIVGVLAGIVTIIYFGLEIWESHYLKARIRLRRRRRFARYKLEVARQKADLLLKQVAEAQALAVKQAAEKAALKVKFGEPPDAVELPKT